MKPGYIGRKNTDVVSDMQERLGAIIPNNAKRGKSYDPISCDDTVHCAVLKIYTIITNLLFSKSEMCSNVFLQGNWVHSHVLVRIQCKCISRISDVVFGVRTKDACDDPGNKQNKYDVICGKTLIFVRMTL